MMELIEESFGLKLCTRSLNESNRVAIETLKDNGVITENKIVPGQVFYDVKEEFRLLFVGGFIEVSSPLIEVGMKQSHVGDYIRLFENNPQALEKVLSRELDRYIEDYDPRYSKILDTNTTKISSVIDELIYPYVDFSTYVDFLNGQLNTTSVIEIPITSYFIYQYENCLNIGHINEVLNIERDKKDDITDSLTPRQKTILLNEYGIIDFMISRYVEGNTNKLASILAPLIGVNKNYLRKQIDSVIKHNGEGNREENPYNDDRVDWFIGFANKLKIDYNLVSIEKQRKYKSKSI